MKGHWKQWNCCPGVSVRRGKKATGAKNETFDLCSQSHWVSLRLYPEIEKTGVKKRKEKGPVPGSQQLPAEVSAETIILCIVLELLLGLPSQKKNICTKSPLTPLSDSVFFVFIQDEMWHEAVGINILDI